MKIDNLKEFLDFYVQKFNNISFIENDPVSIPHKFSKKEDIEISGFLASILAWGKRSEIIKKGNLLVEIMDMQPHDFILNASEKDLKHAYNFYYRTFSGEDTVYFIESLKNIYTNLGGLEKIITQTYLTTNSIKDSLTEFYKIFFSLEHLERTQKHVANPQKGSAAKRLNMFLRWMVRQDNNGVDFGIWKQIKTKDLMLPLDLHSGNSARKLGILKSNQNNWKAVEEVTNYLKQFDSNDPVKYDFALFGVGVDKII